MILLLLSIAIGAVLLFYVVDRLLVRATIWSARRSLADEAEAHLREQVPPEEEDDED